MFRSCGVFSRSFSFPYSSGLSLDVSRLFDDDSFVLMVREDFSLEWDLFDC